MKKVLIVLLVLVLGFVAFVATRPATYHVERTATVAAPPAAVYARIADFREWEAWSPWENLDPAMTKTFEGAESGVGAGYHWAGNDQVGEGRMTITEATPERRLLIRLEFIKPWAATNATAFDLEPSGDGTRVKWTMDGTNDFMGKAMSVFVNMDQMIGKDFERGLASLDSLVRANAVPDTTLAPGAAAAPDSVS
jgi:uncharacterized protein YndB with AHSA1/START domain